MWQRQFSGLQGDFSVFTMNTLADQCAKNDSQGFPHVKPEVLQWENRKEHIISVIIKHSPDFICLQEIDHWFDWYQPILSNYGYQGVWYNGLENNLSRHGVALLWKTAQWTNTQIYSTKYNESTQVFIAGHFVNKQQTVGILTTHLKAKAAFKDIRTTQGKQIIEYINRYQNQSWVIAGDFNAEPDEEVCKLVPFTSCYDQNGFTTKKARDATVSHIIDYIWYKDLKCVGTLELPDEKLLEWPYLPCEDHPSDHLHLMANFKFN